MAAAPAPRTPAEVVRHYSAGVEEGRLGAGAGRLEEARTREMVRRFVPPAPAEVLDVGGGPGAYACWLARLGYAVHHSDPVPLHVEQARAASLRQPEAPLAGAEEGDARRIERPDASADAVLLLGPLYHLPERAERLAALAEARRVLRPGGVLLAAGISRFASSLDGLVHGWLDDPSFRALAERDLRDGQHRNPDDHPHYFTTAYFHHPRELREEAEAAGLRHHATLAIDGVGWLLQDFDAQWADAGRRARLLHLLRLLEAEESLLGASAHLMLVAHAP